MKVVELNDVVPQYLLSAKFEGQDLDEFDQIMDSWNDIAYLRAFFKRNEKALTSGFFGKITINEAVRTTLNEANNFSDELLGCAEGESLDLDQIFKPLYKYPLSTSIVRQENKAYGGSRKSWLRIYAIRITENFYAISGGAIKLTRTMQEMEDGPMQIQKLKVLAEYLKEMDIECHNDYYGYFDI